jgi:hypothetical protein
MAQNKGGRIPEQVDAVWGHGEGVMKGMGIEANLRKCTPIK